MRPTAFELATPETVDDAVDLLRCGPGTRALAGGQSLMPALVLREAHAELLVDLSRLSELRGISANGALRIGAGEPQWDVEHDGAVIEHAPLLTRTLATVGAVAIRHRATLGGSLGWSDPTSQLPAALLALNATVVTSSGRRELAAGFFLGPHRTSLEHGEVIVAVELPSWAGAGAGLHQVRRTAITWPVAGSAAIVRLRDGRVEQARIALYGSGPVPVLAEDAADLLRGRTPGRAAIEDAAKVAAANASPVDDERASASYRRSVLPVLVRRALEAAVAGAA